MRPLSLSVICLGVAMGSATGLAAGDGHVLHGIFCNSEEQIDRTLSLMRESVSPRMAVEAMNAVVVEAGAFEFVQPRLDVRLDVPD